MLLVYLIKGQDYIYPVAELVEHCVSRQKGHGFDCQDKTHTANMYTLKTHKKSILHHLNNNCEQ